ncbi:MAG: glutamate 5-kinase [Deltaproteobacteria bacterium]|nr:glutamate 5-kinase [Deltaproteobacteria bacterium]MDL1961287.1 glutamate 5-kinase [Deltaproteobacteria bacterium]
METRSQIRGRKFLQSVRRIVVKVGSAVLTDENGLDERIIADLCAQIASLRKEDREVTIVSSGAIAAGMGKLLGLQAPKTVPEKQAMAAVGQGRLIQAYENAFRNHGIQVAQILLTREGLVSRYRYLNAKNTLKTLLQWGIIPIINENDTVATEELQFTDNDALAVLIVNLVEAEILICLSDVNGLYDRDPREETNAKRIPEVSKVDKSITDLASDYLGRAGRGGMKSKLDAAQMVTACGVPMVVAKGRTDQVLTRLFSGEDLGTLFCSSKRRIHGRKPWIVFALDREGILEIDEGAVKAMVNNGKSLLPVGIRGVQHDFEAGACVVCCDGSGKEVAVGLSNYNSQDIRKICGCQTGEIYDKIGHYGTGEVIHRDNMVILL